MQDFLINLSTQHTFWVYFVIVIVAILEGPILSVILGIILNLGYLSVVPTFIVLMCGDLLGDVIWYYIGRRWGYSFIKRFGKYVSVTEESVAKMTAVFHKYKSRILIISKVSNGFGFALAVLMAAGMTRIPFRTYIGINIVGQFIWTGLLVGIGYFFGHLYETVDSVLGYVSVTALAVVILAAFMGYRNYIKTKMKKHTL